MSPSKSNLSTESPHLERLRIKAKIEIGEKDELIPEYISKLRSIICDDPSLTDPPKEFDYFLLQCLRARKYNLEKAAKMYKKFVAGVIYDCGAVFDLLIPRYCAELYRKKIVSILSSRDSLGRSVLVIRADKWNPSEHSLDNCLASVFLLLNEALQSIDTQLNGVVCIMDLKGLNLSQVRQIGFSNVRLIVNMLQDSYPARFKEFHIINHPYIFNMIFNFAKPLLTEKFRTRISFHAHDSSKLLKTFGQKMLPSYLGGDLNDEEYEDEEMLKQLFLKDDFYKDFQTLTLGLSIRS